MLIRGPEDDMVFLISSYVTIVTRGIFRNFWSQFDDKNYIEQIAQIT